MMRGSRLHQAEPSERPAIGAIDGEEGALGIGHQDGDLLGEGPFGGERPHLHVDPGGVRVLVMREQVELCRIARGVERPQPPPAAGKLNGQGNRRITRRDLVRFQLG
ncbi:hypothetical protein EN781_05400 [Mesorhizobium sp. M4A.F.Ca.ET.090.04.2.1]|uniref:hypothetical protein n=1 Tax=Mesorhizobium sp. M4A.F.Ca.ET.090.04.2.1 TaxID=2496663 RepID=UPI000FCBF282|nr:hypothetical protein [Mesorhizobium sp. M4A.F.Ca.ET.090.04.2.1]RVC46478.1 hypothetical protein EN781_05400 [Mesorhizobium sp. M4A.F.Ca.ET.090.04.2.1]